MPHRAAGPFFKKRRFVNDAGTSGHINICTNIKSGLRNGPERKSCPARMPKASETAATSCKTMKISANGRVFSCFFQYGPPTSRKKRQEPVAGSNAAQKTKEKQEKDTATSAANGKFATDTNGGQKTGHRTDAPAPYSPPEKNRQKTGNTYTRKSART